MSLRPKTWEVLCAWQLHLVAWWLSPCHKKRGIELHLHHKHYGYHMDYHEKKRKKEGQEAHKCSKAKRWLVWMLSSTTNSAMLRKYKWKRLSRLWKEKHQTKEWLKDSTRSLGKEGQSWAKVLSNMIKQKQKEKVGKWEIPLLKVHAQGETEMLKVIQTGRRKKKAWKRMVTSVCFIGDGFARKRPKYERFIRTMGLWVKRSMQHSLNW